MAFAGERVQRFQAAALALAAGIGVILAHGRQRHAGWAWRSPWPPRSRPAATSSAARAGRVNMLAYTVGAASSPLPALWVMALWHDGPARALHAAGSPRRWPGPRWAGRPANTLFGYGIWSWLLSRHEAPQVVPFALGCRWWACSRPVWWWAEPLPGWEAGCSGPGAGGSGAQCLLAGAAAPPTRRRLT